MTLRDKMLALLVCAAWGANYVPSRWLLDVWGPFLLLSMRFTIVALVLVPFYRTPTGKIRDIIVLSLVLGTVHFGMMFGGMAMGLDVSSTVISSQLGVPFSCLLGSIIFQDRLGRWRSLGMLVSFLGVIIIAGSPAIAENYLPFMVACGGALAWGYGNIYIKRFKDYPMLAVLGWMSLFTAPQLVLLSYLFEEGQWQALQTTDMRVWLSLVYTVLLSSIMGYGVWYSLMAKHRVSQVVPYSLLIPVFGLTFTHVAFAEELTTQFIVGGFATIIGVGIIILRKPEQQHLEQA
ncbi:MAG: EamA family transporter [Alphaproteobacteria bacterium]|nr:MAG: EamA family transporter [Alphaproteobacteria bacterium]